MNTKYFVCTSHSRQNQTAQKLTNYCSLESFDAVLANAFVSADINHFYFSNPDLVKKPTGWTALINIASVNEDPLPYDFTSFAGL